MGWFSSDPKSEASLTSQEVVYKPMKREERKHCWEARDRYNSCLDKNGIVDSIKEAGVANTRCGKESELFERDCARSWVEYFKQKRVADFEKAQKYKKLEEEGAIPVGQGEKPGWKLW